MFVDEHGGIRGLNVSRGIALGACVHGFVSYLSQLCLASDIYHDARLKIIFEHQEWQGYDRKQKYRKAESASLYSQFEAA
ncbi:hypothetical protein [Burkholderia sp. Ax-1719]|uniref:hypothetical protein n=1 Tax=Burkholderia sp. Ax-1719 TaxID=2608334 RepID=UPI0019666F0A|nr:hypothetical protein [Burkholderia sp. Ax-1719]